MKKHLVSFQYCQEISPEGHFEMVLKSKIFKETETLKNIEEWINEKLQTTYPNPFSHYLVQISTPKELNGKEAEK